jgi:succinoglycan biosynthesis protein ExoA
MMPIREEGEHLKAVLDAVINQDYHSIDEILLAVGPSGDGTEEVVQRFAEQDDRVVIIPNPEGIVSTGLNRALDRAVGDLVVRIDGHCLVPTDYVSRLVETSRTTGAACVGPRLRSVGFGRRHRAIAAAMSSRLGVGGSRFRVGAESGYVDTVPFGLYERGRLQRLGGFRTDLVRNQDDELNSRLRRDGGRIWMDARIEVDYVPRDTLRSLWSQYFGYGYWRTISALSFGDRPGFRQLVPAGFVAAVAAAGARAATGRPRPLLVLAAAYAAVLGALGGQTLARTRDPVVAVLAMPAGAVLHAAYGCGMWRSLLGPALAFERKRRPSGGEREGRPSGGERGWRPNGSAPA